MSTVRSTSRRNCRSCARRSPAPWQWPGNRPSSREKVSRGRVFAMKTRFGRRLALAAGVALALGLLSAVSQADPLRVGKPQGEVFSFVPLDVGIEKGIFTKHGIEV